jgi:quercetin dioxygenase-like cupin family protein
MLKSRFDKPIRGTIIAYYPLTLAPCTEVIAMVRKTLGLTAVIAALLSANAFAQAPAAPPASGQAPAAGGAGRGGADRGGGQTVGSQGDPDPGVHFIVIVDNPSVRVLQVTLQPGAVRRPHVHNDVTFHMLIPVTGGLELTADGIGTINAIPGQAYYMVKGQPHGFTNKGGAAVQVIEVFVKPGPGPAPWDPNAPPAPATPPATAAPATRGTPPATR